MAKKYYPVIRRWDVSGGAFQQTMVDVGQCLSRLNHRLYRQSRVYPCNVRLRNDSDLTSVEVYALRSDWMMVKSIQMAYKMYRKATEETRNVMSSKQIARWEDFRINHGIVGANNGAPVIYGWPAGGPPSVPALNILTTGEFELSVVRDQNDVDKTFTLGNANPANEFNILEEYNKAADVDSSPSNLVGPTGTQLPYDELTDAQESDIAADLSGRGNEPPYDADDIAEDYAWVHVGTLGIGANGQQVLSTGFFDAPLGLIMIDGYVYQGSPTDLDISVEVKSGDYKGVMGPSLLE